MRERHPRNAPGDFYVVDGCCLSCGVWQDVAAGLMEWTESDYPSCFVARQPRNREEVGRMAEAMSTQEVDCIRYAGRDPGTVEALVESGNADYCDAVRVKRGLFGKRRYVIK